MDSDKQNLKFINKLSNMFHKIFEPSHLIYTLVFIVFILIISFMSFSVNLSDFVLFFATLTALMFLILTLVGIFKNAEPYLFSTEKKSYPKKLIVMLIALGVSFIILIFYFLFGKSTQISVQFLGWNILLPALYVIIFFGWNLIQIFFLRITFEDIAMKANEKLLKENADFSQNKNLSLILTIIMISLTVLIQILSNIGFISLFSSNSTLLFAFYVWNGCMYALIGVLSYRLIQLQYMSFKNETPNIFSSVFHIIIWIYIWYRSFSFIYSFESVSTNNGVNIIRILTDVFLMILTSFLVLRGLGSRVYRFKAFNPNNLPFFLFTFTILYVEGQVIMIIGGGYLSGVFTSRGQTNLVSNFLVLFITVIFYWWYSKFTLEKRNLIFKSLFSHKEVAQFIFDFKDYLENSGALERNKVNDYEIRTFMENKKIKVNKVRDGPAEEK